MRQRQSRSVLLDLYGAFVRDLGGWIAVADLVRLSAPLGVEEAAVRLSVSRFSRKGLLVRRQIGGRVGYELTETAAQLLAEGDERIASLLEPARLQDGWVIASFSVPEEIRAKRHQLRSRLEWLGYGNLGGGLWIAPRRELEATRDMVASLGLEAHVDLFLGDYDGFDDVRRLVTRCWDVEAIRTVHRDYVAEFAPVLAAQEQHPPEQDPVGAFVAYVTALHEWRKLPYVDPGLPVELLPDDWEGTVSVDLWRRLSGRLEPTARAHVHANVDAQTMGLAAASTAARGA
ncbi:PaaX family transcriptional regulator C-terminal domain-containing protein [Egicoccus sp. AB-alg2]|uniref:PaaX family transcriptional regulator n=1 Tax=Egicoccus sp. AB-alg2 TaxID=3242693 RepID=UPI00359ECE2A